MEIYVNHKCSLQYKPQRKLLGILQNEYMKVKVSHKKKKIGMAPGHKKKIFSFKKPMKKGHFDNTKVPNTSIKT